MDYGMATSWLRRRVAGLVTSQLPRMHHRDSKTKGQRMSEQSRLHMEERCRRTTSVVTYTHHWDALISCQFDSISIPGNVIEPRCRVQMAIGDQSALVDWGQPGVAHGHMSTAEAHI